MACFTAHLAASPATTRRPTKNEEPVLAPPKRRLLTAEFAGNGNSNHYSFLVLPEYTSHRIGNLADSGVGLDRRQDSRHHVLSGARCPAYGFDRLPPFRRVALLSQSSKAF